MLMFGNRSLSMHLLRGIGGLSLVAMSVHLIGQPHGWLAILFMPAALYLLKGCPGCWTIGLFETFAHRVREWSAKKAFVCR